mgnify:FL=1
MASSGVITLVKQRHRNGCGVACLAMATDQTYGQALSQMYPQRQSHDRVACNIISLQAGLRKNQKEMRAVVETDWRKVSEPALLWLKFGSKMDHVVIWDPDSRKILDPIGVRYPKSFYRKWLFMILPINNLPHTHLRGTDWPASPQLVFPAVPAQSRPHGSRE